LNALENKEKNFLSFWTKRKNLILRLKFKIKIIKTTWNERREEEQKMLKKKLFLLSKLL